MLPLLLTIVLLLQKLVLLLPTATTTIVLGGGYNPTYNLLMLQSNIQSITLVITSYNFFISSL